MKATLEFNLPEEELEHFHASRAVAYVAELEGLRENLRRWRKHGHSFASADDLIDLLWRDCVELGVRTEPD